MSSPEQLITWKNLIGRKIAEFKLSNHPESALSFGLSGPAHGWLFFTLDLGESGRFTCRASSSPNDFLAELADALQSLLSGGQEASVAMHGEPDTFVLLFQCLPDGNTRFELHHKPSFESPVQELVWGITTFGSAICNSLVELMQGYGESLDLAEYTRDMGWEFPAARVAELQRLLQKAG